MFVIYSKPNCHYCDQAKSLLKSKNLHFDEHIVDVGQEKVSGGSYVSVQTLKELVPGASSVPQIFSGENLIGGFDKLRTYLNS